MPSSPSSRSPRCARAAPTWCSSAISARSAPSPNTARAAQKARWLPDLLAGRMVMSLGMSEPDAGSAVTDLTTSARPGRIDYIINGTKVFSTFSPDAAIFLIYVRFGPGLGGIGSVIVERGTPGFTIGQPSSFMSGEQWCELHFENCRMPAENVLLGPGGFKKQMASFNVERLGNAARALALGRYAFDTARDHARHPRAVRPAAVRVPGPAMEVRRDGDQARKRAAPALPRRRQCRPRPALRLRDRARQGGLQPDRLRGRQRSHAGHGRVRLQQRKRWSNIACGAPAAG